GQGNGIGNGDANLGVFLGYAAGQNVRNGADNNVIIGANAGTDVMFGSGNILLGAGVQLPTGYEDSYVNIGNVFYGSTVTGELFIGGTGALRLPSGDNTTRPGTLAGTTAINGMIRYNSTSGRFEGYQADSWQDILTGAAIGTLNDLTDVDTTGVSDQEVLTYDSASGTWVPAAVSTDFVGLTDTPATFSGQGGRFARVNSGETAIEFTDQIIETVTGEPAPNTIDLNDLGDVSASPTGGQALIYDSASGVWVAGTVGGGSVGAAGSDREIQFNSGGNMATDSGFVFTSAGLGIGTAVPSDFITIAGDNQDMSMYSYSTSGALSGADINFWRSRGTEGAPFSAVNSGDKIGGLRFYGSTNSNWVNAAQISVMTSATAGSWTSGTDRKADIVFETINGFGNYGERMRIHSDGTVRFISTGAIVLPVGTDAQRPTGEAGMLRYSSTSNTVEYFNGTIWESFATSAGSVSTAGAEGDLQFNSGGELGAVSGLNFNVASGTLSVDSTVNIGGTTGLAAPVGAVAAGAGGSGSTAFTGLSDTPVNYTGAAGQMVVVNSGATGLEFVDVADAGVWTDSGSGYIEYNSALGSMRVASVTGAAAPAGAVAVSNATSLVALTDTSISSVSSGQILTYNGSQWVNVDANSAGLWSSAGGDSIFYNSGSPTVGIGTATPSVELDVAGDINLTGMLMMGQIAGDAPTYISAGSAVGALNDLSDVDTAGVVDGEVLMYSAGSGSWVTGVASGTGLWTDAGGYIEYNSSYGGMKVGSVASVSAPTGMSLNALSDVLAGSPSTNDVLSWNGTNWVPSASAGGGGGSGLWTAGSGDTIYYNSGSFRVGVGTASPANELDVVGDIRVSNSVIFAPVSGMSAPVYMSAGGSGAGASALDDLTDVDTTGVVNGEVLTYSAGNWVSSAVPDTNIWSDSGSGYIEYDVSYGGIRVASVSGASMPPTGAVASGGSAISTLNDLTDVTTTGVADGEVLMYSAGSGSWVTGAASGGGSSLWSAGSGDSIYYTSGSPTVGIGTAAPAAELDVVGDIRVSNSIIIQPVSGLSAPTFISASGSSTALGGLADVDVSGVSDGQVLMYSAGSGNWVAGSGGGGGGAVNDLSDATTDYANGNMFIGSGSGAGITTAQNNTAVGYNALASNDVSNFATAVGAYAAESYDADNQWQAIVAVGSEAARYVTAGSGITAIGNEALENFPGDRNTAVGSIAMFASNGGGGSDNVGIGDGAGSYMAGGNNVVIGQAAFQGGFSGDYDHGGDNNVFIGSRSARDVQGSTTSNNVMLGYQTGLSLRDGSSNIIIGANVDVSGANAANEMNIGNVIYGSGMYNAGAHIGINNSAPDVALDVTGDIEYTGTLTDVSDMRLKKDIAPLDANEIIGRLSQIDTYSFRMINDEKGQLELGVMAQEVEKVFPELVRTANDEMGTKSVNYVGFIAPLIEASKELKSENDALRAEITEMKLAQAEFKDDIMREVNGLKAHTGYGIDKAQIGLWTIALLFGFSSIFFMVGGILRHRQHKQG
ncbi:MAG: tail fiber domain-containing protein, partial [Pseudomonadota bacterium]|nr:tail fiber domain-containing protein [Pseudomonadota bacterium]